MDDKVKNFNDHPISLREGQAFIDGVKVYDCIKLQMQVDLETWEGRRLGDLTPSTRWLGYKITGTITQRRATPWLRELIAQYEQNHETPEMTIQGISDDKGSDYFKEYGVDSVTLAGCVLTGGIPLIDLDSEGQVREDAINFNAKKIV